ncbi:hypothetical protein [Vibrio diabolicus]|uniref:hypothetical protein n=1 Tax=Vibrio diabolicus TaxID=50719 RepID=UPI003D7D4D8C
MAKRNDWSEQELSEAVDAYLEMLHKDEAGIPYVKSKCYQNLADKFGRTPKAFGRRMSNITHIMMLMDLPVVSGLGRLPNVGLKQAPIIERLIADKLKHTYTGVGLTDAEMQSVVKHRKNPLVMKHQALLRQQQKFTSGQVRLKVGLFVEQMVTANFVGMMHLLKKKMAHHF